MLEFEVATFPIVFLLGKDGRPDGRRRASGGVPKSYNQHLDKLREKHAQQEELLERARQSTSTGAPNRSPNPFRTSATAAPPSSTGT